MTIKTVFHILILLLAMSLLSGCTKKVSDEDLLAAHEAVQKGALVIDVRSKKEYSQGHIEGAVNIPIDLLDKMYRAIPKDKELVVYCRTGNRSEVAAHYLREQGWKVHDVVNQDAWNRKLNPREK